VTGTTPPDIFGASLGINANEDTVDLQATMEASLFFGVSIKNNLEELPPVHLYVNESNFARTVMLQRAVIAQWRAWGVAAGIQCNNCSDVTITDHEAQGNSSEKDSAFGILFANRCSNCSVQNAQCNNNAAWVDSELTAGNVDVTAMSPYWNALDVTNSANGSLTETQTVTLGGSRFQGKLTNDTVIDLLHPCGPLAAGIVIGDTSEFVHISDSTCANNQGNAGHAY
jgi:hypothetical protein